jgi:hypothetical protein
VTNLDIVVCKLQAEIANSEIAIEKFEIELESLKEKHLNLLKAYSTLRTAQSVEDKNS